MSKLVLKQHLQFPGAAANRRAVILAGGDGTRLKSLTRAISGDERPKQFCPLMKGESLLELTQKRTARLIKPEHTFFSLTKKHERFFEPLRQDVKRENLVVQPSNKGTAPAILYSLLRVAAQTPQATVAFFPSDHYFSDDAEFMRQVEKAFRFAERNSQAIILLGLEAEKPETAYGWIEPAESVFGEVAGAVSRVARFWEKPSFEAAGELLKKGCLWNSFVMVGAVEAFLSAVKRAQPELFAAFAEISVGAVTEANQINALYQQLSEVNFSHEVLEKSVGSLYVLRVGGVGWSDLGEPQRVLRTLSGIGVKAD